MLNLYRSNNFQKAFDIALNLVKKNQNDYDLYIFIGNIFEKINNLKAAIGWYRKSAEVNFNNEIIYNHLYNFLMKTNLSNYEKEWEISFNLLFKNKSKIGQTKLLSLANKAAKLIMVHPVISEIISKKPKVIEIESIYIISRIKLINKCIEETNINNLEFEEFLILLRKSILIHFETINISENLINLVNSVSANSFFNDYILLTSEEETKKLNTNKFQDIDTENFFHLVSSMFYNSLKTNLKKDLNLRYFNLSLIDHLFNNPRKENAIKSNIISFNRINDKISTKVKTHYENNPYPKWIYPDLPIDKTNCNKFISTLNLNFKNKEMTNAQKSMLVAGCGTGKEVIEYASFLSNVKLTAIDLSKQSLSYAIRKSNEYNLDHKIDFFQCDILNISSLNKKFDYIVSSGVLHHMNYPLKGLKSLLSCLKQNGLIKIALYSKHARKNLKPYQENSKNIRNLDSDELIKNYRNNLIKEDKFKDGNLQNISDFYNISEFRDLVCHEQEHQFDLQQIKSFLVQFNLKFCGFQNVNNIHEKFKNHYKSNEDIYNLDYWDEYEKIFPNTFSQMYQFWLEKIN